MPLVDKIEAEEVVVEGGGAGGEVGGVPAVEEGVGENREVDREAGDEGLDVAEDLDRGLHGRLEEGAVARFEGRTGREGPPDDLRIGVELDEVEGREREVEGGLQDSLLKAWEGGENGLAFLAVGEAGEAERLEGGGRRDDAGPGGRRFFADVGELGVVVRVVGSAVGVAFAP